MDQNRFIYVSESYAHIMGRSIAECMAIAKDEDDWILVHPQDKQRYIDAEIEAYDRGEGIDIEYRIIKPGGSMRFLHEISEAIKNEAGEVIYTSGTIQDITERKQAGEQLRESERKSRAWLENSPVCTKIVDLDFNLQYMSNAGIMALGIDDVRPYCRGGRDFPHLQDVVVQIHQTVQKL